MQLSIHILVFGLAVTACGAGVAQDIQLRAQRGPYFAGDPVVVQVVVRGEEGGSKVNCQLKGKPPADVTIDGPQMSQSSRSFTQIINGRVSRQESVDYLFSFVVTAMHEGPHKIGPFVVDLNGKPHDVAGEVFHFEKLDNDPDMQIELALPGDTFFVGQRIPATLRWSFTGDITAVQYAFSNLQIRSPLFDQFAFDKKRPRTRTTLTIAMAKGAMDIDAKVTQTKLAGRDVFTVTATTTFRATSPGRYTDIPITCRTEKVTEWRRDLFGDRVPGRRLPALASGKPLSFVIKPIPTSGRPASFAGAVGRGFSIAVSANRSIVRVGDPIALTITIRGDSDLSRISLPTLAASPGWSAARFQLPNEQVAGTVDGNTKQFTLNVRVKDTHVQQIPAVAFSWFDPERRQFATTTSKPIALQVMENQVISAADVVSAKSGDARAADRPTHDDNNSAATTPRSFVGANLAIESDPSKLLADVTTGASPRSVAMIIYLVAAGVVLGGVILRRRARRDSDLARRKKQRKSLARQIAAARRRPARSAAEQLATALRQLIAELAPSTRGEIEQMIAECENAIYARDDTLPVDLTPVIDRAEQLIRDLDKSHKSS